jgi:magnesium chelatase family protein
MDYVKESKDRVKAAVKNCGYDFPARRITVNLAPADIKKEGAAFDLPMAIGILAATEVVQKSKLARYFILGELSLDGRIIPGATAFTRMPSAAQATARFLETRLPPA